jgi:hypothetical protein
MLADLQACVLRIDRTGDVPASKPRNQRCELLAMDRRSLAPKVKHDPGRLDLIKGADPLIGPFRPDGPFRPEVLAPLRLDSSVALASKPALLSATRGATALLLMSRGSGPGTE